MCNHISAGKKCQYVGNCSFAHSHEEREVWTYMKDNGSKSMFSVSLTSEKSRSLKSPFFSIKMPASCEHRKQFAFYTVTNSFISNCVGGSG